VNNKGFTLIELLAVITLVGIMAAIAIVSTRDSREGYRFKGAARAIYADLQTARVGAIKGGTEWALCFSADGAFTSYSIRSDPGADRTLCSADDPTPYRKTVDSTDLFSGITYVENFPGTKVSFTPRGTSVNGNVALSNASRNLQVKVNGMTGNIKIQ